MFYIGLYRENVKKSSSLKPQGIWYVASPGGSLPNINLVEGHTRIICVKLFQNWARGLGRDVV